MSCCCSTLRVESCELSMKNFSNDFFGFVADVDLPSNASSSFLKPLYYFNDRFWSNSILRKASLKSLTLLYDFNRLPYSFIIIRECVFVLKDIDKQKW